MSRWQRSKALAAASWSVVRREKELLVLPLLSGLASVAIMVSFIIPIVLTGRTTDATGGSSWTYGPLPIALTVVMYLLLAYVTIYFRTAMLSAADESLRGGIPTLGSALAGANARAGKILPWAIVSATVSIVLKAVQDRAGIVGRIIAGFIGVAWAVVTFLVLPIIVFEGLGVRDAVKKSTAMLKETWGENLIVNAGIGLITLLLLVPVIVLPIAGIATQVLPVAAVAVVLAVLWLVAVMCWTSAMSGVFQAALYRYAADGTVPPAFAQADLGNAFRAKGPSRYARWRNGPTPPPATPGWPSATPPPPPPPPPAPPSNDPGAPGQF